MKRKNFVWFLSELNEFTAPKIRLEQYSTSAQLAADILYTIENDGNIDGKYVADLGVGCGILIIGACRLGAAYGLGIDIDPDALEICAGNILECGMDIKTDLMLLDVTKNMSMIRSSFDTVIMNPPFGTKNNQGIDMKFVQAALSLIDTDGVLYSLHKTTTRNFILREASNWQNVGVQCVAELKWNLNATYRHHRKDSVDIAIDLMRFCKQ